MSVYSYKTEIIKIKTQTELNHENLLQLLKDTIYGMRPNTLKNIQELPNQDNLNLQNLPEGHYTLVKKLLIYNKTDRFEILRFIYKNNGIIHKFDYIIPSNELSNNYFESFEHSYSYISPNSPPFLKLNKKIYDGRNENKDIVFLPTDLDRNFQPTNEDEGKYFFFKYINLKDQDTIYTEVEVSLNHDYKYNPLLDDTLFSSGSITVDNLKDNQNIDLNKINLLEYTLSYESDSDSDSDPNKSNQLKIYCKINDRTIFIHFPFPQTNNFVKYNPQGIIPQPNDNFFLKYDIKIPIQTSRYKKKLVFFPINYTDSNTYTATDSEKLKYIFMTYVSKETLLGRKGSTQTNKAVTYAEIGPGIGAGSSGGKGGGKKIKTKKIKRKLTKKRKSSRKKKGNRKSKKSKN